jgi:DNA polymerase III subunit epsilon
MVSLSFRRKIRGASGAIRNRPWRSAVFCALDFETTGLNLAKDSIVSYGAVTIRDGRIRGDSARYALARPDRTPSPASIAVHALRAVDCAEAPDDRETGRVLGQLLDDKVLVAHAAWIEVSFLKRYLAHDRSRPSRLVVDTAALARATGVVPANASSEPNLEWLALELNVPSHTPHHALGDAMTTAVVFLALVARLARRQPDLTIGALVDLSRRHPLR